MNIYDVSRRAGVSIATVSRVLNRNPNVSKATRTKVLNVMEELGYTPNVFARGLGLGSIRTIGIMCSDSSDPYLAQAVHCLEQGLRDNGYDSILCCTGGALKNKRNYFELLRSKKVDAIILAGSKFIEPHREDNQYIIEGSGEIPVMLLNGFLDGSNIYCTLCDDRAATREAGSLLLASGCRDVLYLYSSRSFSGRNKWEGYRDALAVYNRPYREEYVYQCPKDILAARDLLLRLRGEGLSFDAVMTSDDTLAVGAVKFAHACGLSIPGDLSIIGYNNSSLAVATDPELTSVHSRVETLCNMTVTTLMNVFSGGNAPNRVTIPAALIKRATTK